MNVVFADTYYFIALLNPRDEYHELAKEYSAGYGGRMVLTGWIITELGNTLARSANRPLFLALHESIQHDQRVAIVAPTQDLLERGIHLYGRRPDKDWSLTDCISFVVMQDQGLKEALTADHHFEQAGFTKLLK